MRWLLRWQHVAPGTQVLGERGTLEVLQQLQGFEVPANAWERQIFARRIANYDPKVLDKLCLTGAVGWGRLCRIRLPLRIKIALTGAWFPRGGSIAFFVREDADWMISPHAEGSPRLLRVKWAARDALNYLRQRGASFFADPARHRKIESRSGEALWELVTAGLITADGFDNIRALIDPKRRAGQGRGHSTGRVTAADGGRSSIARKLPIERGSQRLPAGCCSDATAWFFAK